MSAPATPGTPSGLLAREAELEKLRDSIVVLRDRARAIADRLLEEPASPTANVGVNTVSGGPIARLAALVTSCEGGLGEVHAALDRLEKALF